METVTFFLERKSGTVHNEYTRGEEGAHDGRQGVAGHSLQELSFALGDVEYDDKIVLICRTGTRAGQVKALLENEGFHNIEVLKGGMTAYKGELVKGE